MESSTFFLALLITTSLLATTIVARAVARNGWSIMEEQALDQLNKKKLGINLEDYCQSWKFNVDVNNLRAFQVVPDECVLYICNYMGSQYTTDIQLAIEESVLYLAFEFVLGGDGKDAWIFDVDDTLLSTLPYFSNHSYGGEHINATELEMWKAQGVAPPLDQLLNHYNKLKSLGLKIFIITSRTERIRDATVANLFAAQYEGWTELIMRCNCSQETDGYKTIEAFKSGERQKLIEKGYRIWGIMGDQWSSLVGFPNPKRFFKLPNPMYYDV